MRTIILGAIVTGAGTTSAVAQEQRASTPAAPIIINKLESADSTIAQEMPPVIRTVAPPLPPPAPPPPPISLARSATPRGNPGYWVGTNDYPESALFDLKEGITAFTLEVSAEGRVASCSITETSGHADLDEATCQLVSRRARFSPALNEEGNAVIGTYSNSVRWVQSRRDGFAYLVDHRVGNNPATIEAALAEDKWFAQLSEALDQNLGREIRFITAIVRARITPAGQFTGCTVERPSGTASFDNAICRALVGLPALPPTEVEDEVRIRFIWEG